MELRTLRWVLLRGVLLVLLSVAVNVFVTQWYCPRVLSRPSPTPEGTSPTPREAPTATPRPPLATPERVLPTLAPPAAIEIVPLWEPPHLFKLEFRTGLWAITGYAVDDDFTPGEITASGRKVYPGITAACPDRFDLGAVLYIEDIGIRICEDRGSLVVNNIDIAFATPEEAITFGMQMKMVAVIW